LLQILFADQRVGRLWDRFRKLCFQYSPEWCENPKAFPLSPLMPLGNTVICGDIPLFFFANLLPEGNVLDTILKLRRLPRGKVYSLLEAFGEDAAGAFSIVPDGSLPTRASSYVPYSLERLHADLNRLGERLPLLVQHSELRLSLAGAQNKIPVRYKNQHLSLPQGGASSTHILKPPIQPAHYFPDSVQNEAFCLQLAKASGLNVANVDLLHVPEPVLMVERYDRLYSGDNIERIHQLDFCQMAGVLPDQKYEKDGGPGLKQIFHLIDQWSSVPAKNRLQALDWVLFNYLMGNADAHAKNISMLVHSRYQFELAPAYDIVCTALYPELKTQMAMNIGGEGNPKKLQTKHWQRLAQDLGVNPVLLSKRAKQLAQRMDMCVPVAARQLDLTMHPIVGKIHAVLQERASDLETALAGL
jgi:serine/threonine-protein kinase HipA